MVVLTGTRELTLDEMRNTIVSDLERLLPSVGTAELDREVVIELNRFDSAPVRQYLPLLVARRIRDHHR